jgi:hypothetical protein
MKCEYSLPFKGRVRVGMGGHDQPVTPKAMNQAR